MADERSIGELTRAIEDFRRDVRDDFAAITGRLDQFVLREVYLSDGRADNARFERIEAELKRASANRVLLATLAFTGLIAPVVVGIVVWLVTKGSK